MDEPHVRLSPDIVMPWQPHNDMGGLLSREWLVTNGLGGYSSSTLMNMATRRYHGVFVPDLPSPRGRTVVLPRLDEEIELDTACLRLNGVEYADGRLESDLSQCLTEFRREWHTPIWHLSYRSRHVEKRIIMPYGQNTVYVEYRLVSGDPLSLRLRPFLTFRMVDAPLSQARQPPFPITILEHRFEAHLCEGVSPMKLCLRPQCGVFVADYQLSRGVSYRVDRDRGSLHVEDLASPGYFTVELSRDRPVAFVASMEPWEVLDYTADSIFLAEQQRLAKLDLQLGDGGKDEFETLLSVAADQFVIFPGSRLEEHALAQASGDDARTVIAGYHWFTDWGRDTMISLEGLTLCTGRHREARAILRTFARYIKDGLLPNLFPEGERTGLYHTVDATLWYFHALDRYYEVTGDRDTLMQLYPVLKDVMAKHIGGTSFGIRMDPGDGLLKAGAAGYALTWMDAKVEDWVVTPRRGKPVEIQALWYNAVQLMGRWTEDFGERPDRWREMAKHIEDTFNARYWYEGGGYLYDVVDGEQGDDSSLRPNQIFSVSLRYPVLKRERWKQVLAVVREHLLTPVGLRSLAPGHRDYKSMYFGDLRARDAAYHQGTVWAWLIGHFVDAWLKAGLDQSDARRMLTGFISHLSEGGIGTISEIFDAEPPYIPRGCIGQAWSVAEVLRAYQATKGAVEFSTQGAESGSVLNVQDSAFKT
jgi:predicted glycogen debranching enzyme